MCLCSHHTTREHPVDKGDALQQLISAETEAYRGGHAVIAPDRPDERDRSCNENPTKPGRRLHSLPHCDSMEGRETHTQVMPKHFKGISITSDGLLYSLFFFGSPPRISSRRASSG